MGGTPMVTIKLLGRPALLGDGVELEGPRGKKSWGLLAYLVGCATAVPRERLVRLLFPDAEDGLAALRWNLAELRRITREPHAFMGDPVTLSLPRRVQIDVHLLAAAPWYEVIDQIDLSAPLLEGITFPSCAGFELWLEGERQRVAALAAAALREAAREEIASGRPDEAVGHARRLVALQPWDENCHELLVRALAQSGDTRGARAHVRRVTKSFLDELGVTPSRSLSAAAEPLMAPPAQASRTRTEAQLQAGVAAVSAGASDTGIASLRRAVAGARAVADPELLVMTLIHLGSAQIHAVRGADEAGAAALHEAVAVAERVGRPGLATSACRELAWVEFLRCRFEPAERWLDRAMATVGADDSERAWILLTRGSLRSDAGRYEEAVPLFLDAVRHAEHGGDLRASAMALTHLGRLRLLRGEDDLAAEHLDRAQDLAQQAGWLTFMSYPLSWRAEVAMRAGRHDEAAELFSRAHALALEVADPCWESLACRGLGLIAAERGDHPRAARLLHDSRTACQRVNDAYVWLEAYGLAAQAGHALANRLGDVEELLDDLDQLASEHGMRELQAEASMLRVSAGRTEALEAARSHVAAVDNPGLSARFRQLEAASARLDD
ncbi:MAG: tetratricopeptide repeat protein [Actinomycetes bacterium]